MRRQRSPRHGVDGADEDPKCGADQSDAPGADIAPVEDCAEHARRECVAKLLDRRVERISENQKAGCHC